MTPEQQKAYDDYMDALDDIFDGKFTPEEWAELRREAQERYLSWRLSCRGRLMKAQFVIAAEDEEEIMSEAKHTPLPWCLSDSHGLCIHKDGSIIADMDPRNWREGEPAAKTPGENHANGEFILLSCRAHDALLASCKELLSAFDRSATPNTINAMAICDRARAAIALAVCKWWDTHGAAIALADTHQKDEILN